MSRIMLLAALVTVPAAAFLSSERLLFFFLIFPLGALIQLDFSYFKRVIFLVLPISLILMWAELTGNHVTFARSIRWICAASAGGFFANSLGAAGISAALGSVSFIPLLSRLADVMSEAGAVAGRVRSVWREMEGKSIMARFQTVLSEAFIEKEPAPGEPAEPGKVALIISVVSWLFLLGVVSGRLT